MTASDTRIVYGANKDCLWWDDISQIGRHQTSSGHRLPCCPHCGGMLFEMPSPEAWFRGVDRYEGEGHPGYRKFVEWWRGKHFRSMVEARKQYREETSFSTGMEGSDD